MASLRRGASVSILFTVFGRSGIVLVYLLLPMNGRVTNGFAARDAAEQKLWHHGVNGFVISDRVLAANRNSLKG
ncbi:MAG: hypothetical protein WAK26_20450 [Terracidiphilus sp.]